MANFDGGATDDIYVGGDANDDIKGNGGNDRLTGGGGNDVIDGGAGTDFAVFSGLLSDYRFIWDPATQRLIVADLRPGSPDGADIVTSIERFQFSNVTINLNQALARAVAPIQGTAGDDSISPTAAPAGQARPGGLADLVKAGNGQDMVDGGGGNDFLYGEAGNDVLAGGDGADRLDGGDGDDTLYAGLLSPAFSKPVGLNPFIPPLLDTGTAVDTLIGGAGNDRIFAGYGDHVDGGSNDAAGDILYISFQGATTGVSFDARLATQTIGGGTITGIEVVEWLEGSNFDDTLIAGTDLRPIFGMGGNDHIVALPDAGSLYGGDGNDLIDARGSQYSSLIDGGNGDDTIQANSNGHQVVYGGDGNDIIYGNHRIYGGAGNDRIFVQSSVYQQEFRGGDGDDVITVELGFAQFSMLQGDAGNDTIIGGVSNERIEGGAGDDLLIGGGGNGDRAFYSGRMSDYRFINDSASGQLIVIDMRPGSPDGTDVLRTIEQFQFLDGARSMAQVLAVAVAPTQGTAGNDSISATSAPAGVAPTTAQADIVYGNDGNDSIDGAGGNDWLYGGAGTDHLTGGAGNDHIVGGDHLPQPAPWAGDRAIYSGTLTDYAVSRDQATGIVTVRDLRPGSPDGTDTLEGIEVLGFANGNYLVEAVLSGHAIPSTLFEGSDGDDIFQGSEGFDRAIGGAGDDILYGNGSADILIGGSGADTLDGGASSDRLYSADESPREFYAPGVSEAYVAPLLDTGSKVDTLRGGADDDDFFAGYGDHVDGGSHGNYGDRLYLSLMGASSGVTADFRQSTLVIGGGTITGIETVPWIEGSNFDDDITASNGNGSSGWDVVFGMGGNDRIVAGGSTATIFGGEGNDRIDARASLNLYLVDGGTGDDLIEAASHINTRVRGGEGNDVIHAGGATWGDAGNDIIHVELSIYNADVHGGEGDDQIFAPAAGYATTPPILYGDGGNDGITGGGGDDRMNGGARNDTLIGGGGNDLAIYTGRRSDYRIAWDPTGQQFILTDLRPGSPDGTDVVSGVERFQFSDGIRQATALPAIAVKPIQGTAGDDLITPTSAPAGQAMPGAQVDVIYGGAGNDTLQGGGDDDWMYGGTGDDNYIIEDAGDHMVERAGEGVDTAKTATVDLVLGDHVENGMLKGTLVLAITGNTLDNDLRGNGAANVITGGGGADQLTGGGGADIFKYLAAADSTIDLPGRDTIFDFSQLAGDRIDLAGIDADGNAANGDSVFAFIGDGDFTMVAGQLRSVYDGTNTTVFGDIDGDGNADFAITLSGEISLTGTDFYL